MVTAELYGCKAPPPFCRFLFLPLGRGSTCVALEVRAVGLQTFLSALFAGGARGQPLLPVDLGGISGGCCDEARPPGAQKGQVSVRRCRQVRSREVGHGEGLTCQGSQRRNEASRQRY